MKLKIFITAILSTCAIQASAKKYTYDTCTCDVSGWKFQFTNSSSSQVIISMFDIWGTNHNSNDKTSLSNEMTPSIVINKIVNSSINELETFPFVNNHAGIKDLCNFRLIQLKKQGVCTNNLFGYSRE